MKKFCENQEKISTKFFVNFKELQVQQLGM